MRAIFMHVDAVDLFRVDVAADVVAAIDDQTGLSGSFRLMREHGTREASPHDKIIVMRKRWLQNYRHRRNPLFTFVRGRLPSACLHLRAFPIIIESVSCTASEVAQGRFMLVRSTGQSGALHLGDKIAAGRF